MKKTIFSRVLAFMLVVCMIAGFATMVSAASVADATIDTTKVGSIELYKYDLTNAEKDGVWDSSYVSTGVYDQDVNDTLGGAVRSGDDDNTTDLGNGETSYGYAIKGVEFTFLKVAEIVQFTESTLDGGRTDNHTIVLYGISKANGADLLAAIGLTEEDRYVNADASDKDGWSTDLWYFESDTLIDALKAALQANSTTVKNALETYVVENGGTAMELTDEYGYATTDDVAPEGLPLGLYLFVETKVPEMVVDTTDPFFVSVPMTSVNGTNTAPNGSAPEGGTEWLYDVTIYPKNLTGIPSLEKTLRENVNDTGKNDGSATDITDGYWHTGTASDGDVIDYQIISTLPSITSASTYLTDYTFVDTLSAGLTYNKNDVVLEFFTDEACTDLITTWNEADGNFTVSYGTTNAGESVMTIRMTEDGLNQINTSKSVYTGEEMVNSGYSDCTLRITYAATMDSNNEVVYGDSGNPNTVVLTWSRTSSSYYDTLVDDAHVYTYGIDLTKVFSDGNGNFENVEFVIHNDTDNYFVVAELNEEEGIYYVTDHVSAEADATHFIPVESDGNPGKVIVKGLEDDTYTITEVRTDDGYTLLKEDIEVVISQVESTTSCEIYDSDVLGLIQNDPRYTQEIIQNAIDNGLIKTDGDLADILNNLPQKQLQHYLLTASATVDGNAVAMLTDNGSVNAEAPLTVTNTKGFDLPQTGELGTWMLTIGGTAIVLMAAVVIFFVAMPRKKQEQ